MHRIAWAAGALLVACSGSTQKQESARPEDGATADQAPSPDGELANATAVVVSGEAGAYQFSVTISSPDLGCQQYADWWEVVSADGSLVYRRVLAHSHKDEQPFSRSGGPVAVSPDDELIVRAHMNPGGYGGGALRGTASGGFSAAADIDAAFASELSQQSPLPDGCAF